MGDVRNRGTRDNPRWYCRFVDLDGRRKQRATRQPTKALAEKYLAEVEARVARGLVGIMEPSPAERERATITVETLARRFLGEAEGVTGYSSPAIKNLAHYRRDARSVFNSRILPTFGLTRAAKVTRADVERLRDAQLSAGLSPETVTHTLASLSKLYNWARRLELVDCPNPVEGVARPRTSHTVDFLEAGEVAQLLTEAERQARAADAPYVARVRAPMVATALYAGLRKGELLGLRWADFHPEAGRLDVMRSYKLVPKSGKPRHVPIHPELTRGLAAWQRVCPETNEGVMFPIEAGSSGRLRIGAPEDNLDLAQLLTDAGCHAPIDGKPWHLLRHTFASSFVMAGGSLFVLQRILGHATAAMTQRYAHLAPDFMAGEVARLDFTSGAGDGSHPRRSGPHMDQVRNRGEGENA